MIIFSNCKINIGLRILRKRNDGYHDLETVFCAVPWQDIIEAVRTESTENFTASGIVIDIDAGSNLCMKAYRLLKNLYNLPPVHLHLHKTVPAGAGLGGGSADAAFTLKLLDQKFRLGLTEEELIALALQLGSDCPFFIINRPSLATGRGENLKPVDLAALRPFTLVIVNPGIHISTAWAFANITPNADVQPLEDLIKIPVEAWKDHITNDFEPAVFQLHPQIGEIKKQLYDAGAVYASLSGSGSSVFGLFRNSPSLAMDHRSFMLETVL